MKYTVADPSGNITLLIESPCEPENRRETALALMSREPFSEQAGFLGPGDGECDVSLYMSGGEFCGNAAMSAAAWLCRERGMCAPGEEAELRVRVSGEAEPVSVHVRCAGNGEYDCRITMPAPLKIEMREMPLVHFGGISHYISEKPAERAAAEAEVRERCAALGVDALGTMFLDETAGEMMPLVYVRESETLFWEHSCASGTAAAGAYLAAKAGKGISVSLAQPGGTLRVEAEPGRNPVLFGKVRLNDSIEI